MKSAVNNVSFGVVLFVFQIAFLILFGIFGEYSSDSDARLFGNATGKLSSKEVVAETDHKIYGYYPKFQDVHSMMYIGFGFLMTFLKRYAYSAVALNFVVAAFVAQWALIFTGFLHMSDGKFYLTIAELFCAEFTSATVLISFGALLGKISPLQLIIMAFIEIPICMTNEFIGVKYFKTVDMGGSMFVHTFGAYFGIACSRMLYKKQMVHHPKESANYNSDLFAMIGTIFLWLFWPSFNSGLASSDDAYRAIINTYLSLSASTMSAFAMSQLLSEDGKISMVHVQNATLAGGVAIGTSCDMMVQPWGALVVGSIAGIISVVGYVKITPGLAKMKFHDTCGVNNLHGMPGVFSAIVGIIVSALATFDIYGFSMYHIWDARAPVSVNGTAFTFTVKDGGLLETTTGLGRTAGRQGIWQAAALGLTLLTSLVGGSLTGLIIRLPVFSNQKVDFYFDDRQFFEVPDEGFNEGDQIKVYEHDFHEKEDGVEMK